MNTNNRSIQFDSIKKLVAETTFRNLPDNLYYHAPAHTLDDVLPRSIELAKLENINDEALFLLKCAVLFHDAGFEKSFRKNEIIGADMADAVLPQFGVSSGQLEVIRRLIMATVVSDTPGEYIQSAGEDILEKIICDADLDNLGREDFFSKGDALRKELAFHGSPHTDHEWYTHQLDFIKRHKYYTENARKSRDAGKRANIKKLENILSIH
jgi:predicted metal-dependent HD superfamily phosphohydrolase